MRIQDQTARFTGDEDTTAAAIAAEAQQRLGSGDLPGALALLRRECPRHPPLATTLAECLLFFVGDAEAIQEAVEGLIRAEPDDPAAGYLLAWLALGGRALPLDPGAIAARLARAAAAGHPLALRALALAASRSDPDQARALLERGMLAGDPVAGLLLAEHWRRGEGGATDRDRLAVLDFRLARAGYAQLPAIEVEEACGAAQSDGLLDAMRRVPTGRPLAVAPRVERFDALLSADECRFLIAMARPLMKRSTVHDPSSGDAAALPVRTSSDAAFDLMHEDAALRLLQLRLARVAGLAPAHGEPLIVLHYRPGEAYRPHRDYLAPSALSASRPDAGQRRSTVCVYLNSVGAGGGTSFPDLGIESPAVAGAAVVFDNLTPEGVPEPRSLHAGDPVQRGEKWLATLWLRERPLRDF
jgi:hypothetical protein